MSERLSGLDEFLIAHRHQLKVVAELGLMLTLAYLAGICFGKEWPAREAWLPLGAGSIVLGYLARRIASSEINDQDWLRVPKSIRVILQLASRLLGPVVIALSLFTALSVLRSGLTSEVRLASRVVDSIIVALLYTLECLFFHFGELRTIPAEKESSD